MPGGPSRPASLCPPPPQLLAGAGPQGVTRKGGVRPEGAGGRVQPGRGLRPGSVRAARLGCGKRQAARGPGPRTARRAGR